MKTYRISKKHEYACLLIGDEILGGHIKDTNSEALIRALSPKGYVLKELRIVSDEVDIIAEAVSELRCKYSFLVTTGGIGPTHDDKTFEAMAKSFGQDLITHDDMIEYFLRRKSDRTEDQMRAIRRMSYMPEEIELIQLDDSTFPLLKIRNTYVMPGLPSACSITIDKLARILPEQEARYYAEWFLDAHEHDYEAWLRALEDKYNEKSPAVLSLGSYPIDMDSELRTRDGIKTKLSMTAANKSVAESCSKEINDFVEKNNFLIRVNK